MSRIFVVVLTLHCFFFKQKTAYEIDMWLEFRRVLFRSRRVDENRAFGHGAAHGGVCPEIPEERAKEKCEEQFRNKDNPSESEHTPSVECAFAAGGTPSCRGLVHTLSTGARLDSFAVHFHTWFEPKAHFTAGHRVSMWLAVACGNCSLCVIAAYLRF